MSHTDGQPVKDLAGRRVLVAVTGGIAAYKTVDVVRRLLKRGAEVRVMMTHSATRFVHPTTFSAISGRTVGIEMFDDSGSSSVDHLEMPHWADLILIAPATANIIAKMAVGIADDLVSTALLAANCPLLIAPAMNTHMFANPVVTANLELLKARGVGVVGPERGEMAAPGEEPGLGRMSDPETIERIVATLLLDGGGPLAGKRVVVTTGRTEEPIDDVRVMTNRSSGRMGVALAQAAQRKGAEVILIHGPMDLPVPQRVEGRSVQTAEQMLSAVKEVISDSDMVIYAAAVADWRPKKAHSGKLKREKSEPAAIELAENPDIAAETAKLCRGTAVGFALETSENLEFARAKLARKGLDVILLNTLSAIGSAESELIWVEAAAEPVRSGRMEKELLADWVITRLVERL